MVTKVRTLLEERIFFEHGNELGKMRGRGVTHRVVVVLLNLPELESAGKFNA